MSIFNDQGQTANYDFAALNDRDFMFVCMQDDGEVWSQRFTTFKGPLQETEYKLLLSPNKIGEYAGDIQHLRLMDQIKFFDPIRIPSFKTHSKITEKFKRTEDRDRNVLRFDL